MSTEEKIDHWSYRLVRAEMSISIYVVFFNENNEPIARHSAPSYVSVPDDESIEDLETQLEMMAQALTKPVLEDNEFKDAS